MLKRQKDKDLFDGGQDLKERLFDHGAGNDPRLLIIGKSLRSIAINLSRKLIQDQYDGE